jgi:hypothetical protein
MWHDSVTLRLFRPARKVHVEASTREGEVVPGAQSDSGRPLRYTLPSGSENTACGSPRPLFSGLVNWGLAGATTNGGENTTASSHDLPSV